MERFLVNPPALKKPLGFSHGCEVIGGRLLFLSGQVASDKEGNIVGRGDIVAQFRQVCENLKILVEDRGGTLQDVVKLTIYVTDRDDYRAKGKAIGQVYRDHFGRHYPSMSLVEVKGLFDGAAGAMIEIEGIAALPED
jgi:enamine deaminase RidA (YjgF/YER057c/UK114 family)